jgi:hypothetical protein
MSANASNHRTWHAQQNNKSIFDYLYDTLQKALICAGTQAGEARPAQIARPGLPVEVGA